MAETARLSDSRPSVVVAEQASFPVGLQAAVAPVVVAVATVELKATARQGKASMEAMPHWVAVRAAAEPARLV
jgi:hypothetical protein